MQVQARHASARWLQRSPTIHTPEQDQEKKKMYTPQNSVLYKREVYEVQTARTF